MAEGRAWNPNMGAAAAQDPLAGSYTSAFAAPSLARLPPASNTVPSSNRVAVRDAAPGSAMSPVGVHVPVAGSYSAARPLAGSPYDHRTTSTIPSSRAVARMSSKAWFPVAGRLVVAVQDRVSGSYSSAASVALSGNTSPPATSTLPSGSSVAVGL